VVEIVVVGAGLGGLAAAVALRRAGHAVTVPERAPALRETGSGLGITANGVLALDALGIGAAVRDWASPEVENAARDRTGRAPLALPTAELARRAGAPLCVASRQWLHGVLAGLLPAGTVRTGVAVEAGRPGRAPPLAG
jgi:2-polyprenyl-6-methoxyphenol hydroxylase-like FAD-dependent oxidoreductase